MEETDQLEPLPSILKKNAKLRGKTWLAGFGNRNARIMFVTPCVLEEEAAEIKEIGFKKTIPRTPRVGDTPHWSIFRRLLEHAHINPDDCFYVPVIRYLPDIKHRSRPTKTMAEEALPLLKADIQDIKPDIVVCMGKWVFDQLVNIKMKESDIMGAWFYNKELGCRVFPSAHITLTMKPDKYERFRLDIHMIKDMLDSIDGVTTPKIPEEYIVINNALELYEFVNRLESENQTLLSVDCEWEGHQHVDGQLRSLQICWAPGKAAYIRFMDENLNYVFDVPYDFAGQILGTWCNRPEVKYIGHHVSADLVWMAHWLKLAWRNKAVFDTEFALQCCDESLDLGLDILALRYTDFGKYDFDLIKWRKDNPDKKGDGYGQVPDRIIIPYALKDVDTVMRAYKPISQWMERQNLTTYYNTILNPLVTNVFTSFTLTGMPVDIEKMNDMRELYQWAKLELTKEFQKTISDEAELLLKTKLFGELGEPGEALFNIIHSMCSAGDIQGARKLLSETLRAEAYPEFEPVFEHYVGAPDFNIRSKPQMQRWLFEVKKYTPVKSTANKEAGMPSLSWDKILTFPKSEQAKYTPASDKSTLEILAARHADQTIAALLELNAVGNICKAFLKEAEVDDDGELVKEQGLHYWATSDDRICSMSSVTETGNRY